MDNICTICLIERKTKSKEKMNTLTGDKAKYQIGQFAKIKLT